MNKTLMTWVVYCQPRSEWRLSCVNCGIVSMSGGYEYLDFFHWYVFRKRKRRFGTWYFFVLGWTNGEICSIYIYIWHCYLWHAMVWNPPENISICSNPRILSEALLYINFEITIRVICLYLCIALQNLEKHMFEVLGFDADGLLKHDSIKSGRWASMFWETHCGDWSSTALWNISTYQ
jgi:hypothetical protein